MNPTKDVAGVADSRIWKDKVSMGNNSIKYSRIKFVKTTRVSSYHRKKIYKSANESNRRCKRSCGDKTRTDRRTGRMDGGVTHTRTNEVIYLAPPLHLRQMTKRRVRKNIIAIKHTIVTRDDIRNGYTWCQEAHRRSAVGL